MNFQKILLPILGAVLIVVAWQTYGWQGAALAVTAVVMYLLMQFNRLMHVLKKAAHRPKGYVASAVMLNVKLKPGVTLLHVTAMTQALGEQLSPAGEEPEVFRWTDGGGSHVTCEFARGKLAKWALFRPPEPADSPETPAP